MTLKAKIKSLKKKINPRCWPNLLLQSLVFPTDNHNPFYINKIHSKTVSNISSKATYYQNLTFFNINNASKSKFLQKNFNIFEMSKILDGNQY